jgi:hypothetical protein
MHLQKDDDGVEVVRLAGGATPARDTHMHSPVFFAMQQDDELEEEEKLQKAMAQWRSCT